MTTQYTAFLRLPLPDFLTTPWQDSMEASFRAIDAAIHNALTAANTDVWDNAIVYEVGQLVTSPEVGSLWVVLVAHTSAVAGTFADDRVANPTYWQQIPTIPQQRGMWTTATTYFPGDFVVDSNRYAVALLGHTSTVFNTDLAADKWVVLVDVSAAQPGINTAAEGTLPSAATIDIGAETPTRLLITGTATITSFGAVANTFKILRFNDAAKIIHNATTLVLLQRSSRTTQDGDVGMYASDGSGNWYEQFYSPAPGTVIPQGRLTLTTATPVMTATASAQTTIYYTPYVGNQITLYDGNRLYSRAFSELSVATTDTASSPAAIGAVKVNDWFVWENSAGVLKLVHGPDWTDDTTRSAGTALVVINGLRFNNVSITNGPAASRGLYVGTTRSDASSKLNWILGAAASGGTAAHLQVWNCFNRVTVSTRVTDNGVPYTYTSATVRVTRGAATMFVYVTSGLAEDSVQASYTAYTLGTSATPSTNYYGMGLDTVAGFTTSPTVNYGEAAVQYLETAPNIAVYPPMLGAHYIEALEAGDGTTASTFNSSGSGMLSVTARM